MKKILILTIAVALAVMLTFPAILFAEEGDANSWIGRREPGPGGSGQYIIGDKDKTTPQPNDTIGDNNSAQVNNGNLDEDLDGERDGAGATGDGDTEIFCIDGDTYLTGAANAYELTDIDVSDELFEESAPRDDDNNDAVINDKKTDGIIDAVEAEAVEILASEATGATSPEDQVSVWKEVGDKNVNLDKNTSDAHTNENVDKITEAVEKFATDFIELTDGTTLEEFLDEQDVNEIDVTVEQDAGIFTGDAGTAIAIMENPLVPTITDEEKDVFWYILEGAFNMSFHPDYLLMETSSASASVDGSDAEQMTDEIDNVDGDDIDNDGQEGPDDHYGIATVSYYYYYWGFDEHPEGTMGLDLYAWVDVDEDGLFDIVDIDSEKAADGIDSDGDVVGEFQDNHQVVQVEIVDDKGDADPTNDDTVIKTDGAGNLETAPMPQTDMDIHKVEGGKVVLAKEDIALAERDDEGNLIPGRDPKQQRFTILSYTEPYDEDPIYFGTIAIKVNEADEGLEGAVFGIYDNENTSGDPIETVTSDENGFVSTEGLIWEGSGNTYYLKELSAPTGYNKINTVFEIFISGHGLTVSNGEEEGSIPFIVTNKKTPPEDPEDPEEPEEPEEPDTPEEEVSVAGLAELPFTGMSMAVPIAGISTLFSGLGLFIWSLIARMINRKKNLKNI